MINSKLDKEIKSEPPSLYEEENHCRMESEGGSNRKELGFKSPLDEIRQEVHNLRGLITRSMVSFLETIERIDRENQEVKNRLTALEKNQNFSSGFGGCPSVRLSSPVSDSSISSSHSSTSSRGSRDKFPDRYHRRDDRRTRRRDRSRSRSYSGRRRDHREVRHDNHPSNDRSRPDNAHLLFSHIDTDSRVYNAPHKSSSGTGWSYEAYKRETSQIDARDYSSY